MYTVCVLYLHVVLFTESLSLSVFILAVSWILSCIFALFCDSCWQLMLTVEVMGKWYAMVIYLLIIKHWTPILGRAFSNKWQVWWNFCVEPCIRSIHTLDLLFSCIRPVLLSCHYLPWFPSCPCNSRSSAGFGSLCSFSLTKCSEGFCLLYKKQCYNLAFKFHLTTTGFIVFCLSLLLDCLHSQLLVLFSSRSTRLSCLCIVR